MSKYSLKDRNLVFAPYTNNTIPANQLFAANAGNFYAAKDGRWPVQAFMYDFWWKENEKWYKGVTIHAGLNPFLRYEIHGKEFLDYLEMVSVNTFRKFPVGKARHTICCAKNGKILLDGIVVRRSEEDFQTMCLLDPIMLKMVHGKEAFKPKFRYKNVTNDWAFYQLCGDKSLQVVEKACQQDLHDIKFMFTKNAKIKGHDVYILRTGMSGTLAYEVHCKIEHANEIYNELLRCGQEFDIQQLGRLGYINQHCEGSIPQVAEHYAVCGMPGAETKIFGSLPQGHELMYRSPIDNGWGNLIRWNHDFTGKEALMKEWNSHHNDMVHLIWNKEDVIKVISASMDPELRVDPMDLVCDFDYARNTGSLHIDAVYDGDKLIGAASGRMTSAYTREMISLCTLDEDYAVDGKEVEVLWGNPGTTQMRIRATVKKFPYFTEDRNENYDLEKIPHYQPAHETDAEKLAGDYCLYILTLGFGMSVDLHLKTEGDSLRGNLSMFGMDLPITAASVKGESFRLKLKIKTPVGNLPATFCGSGNGITIKGTFGFGKIGLTMDGILKKLV